MNPGSQLSELPVKPSESGGHGMRYQKVKETLPTKSPYTSEVIKVNYGKIAESSLW